MRKLIAASLALGLALSFTAFGSLATAGAATTVELSPDRTVDRELVTVDMTAEGTIVRTSLVDSLSVYGNGFVKVTDRNEPKGLRNLEGFQAPESVSGINVTWAMDVNGKKELLTVAPDIDKKIPVSVTPSYFIAGQRVDASKLAGYSGDVTIQYRIVNTTRRTEMLDVTDKTGKVTKTALETFVPLVGQTSFELPSNMWSSIDAPGASIVTDDNNLNHVTFTSILAPLVGTPDQTVKLSGRVKNLELTQTRIVFQPLLPGVAEDTARATAEGSSKLFAGVGQIDANLGLLQAGTLELIAGLEKLYAGIISAQTGLGSVGKSDTIVDGLKQVLDGLKSLGDSKAGMPAIKLGVDQLAAGINEILVGLGSASQPTTILGGLAQVGGGLGQLGAPAGLPAAKGGVDQVNAGLAQAKTGLTGLQAAVGGSVAEIQGASATLGCPGSLNPACPLLDSALNSSHGLSTVTLPGLAGLLTGTDQAIGGLTQVSAGLAQAIGAVGQLSAGVTAVTAGVQQVKTGLKSGSASNPGILEGLQAVAAGLTEAIAGIGTVGVADTLTDGTNKLFTGSQDLATGMNQIAAGTNDAAAGAKQIGDGQSALSVQGTKALQAGVGDNVQQASSALAVLGSMKQRAANESSLYGPPEGSAGSSTYVVRVGAISARNAATVLRFAVGALLLLMLVAAGVQATRKTAQAVMA